MNLYIIDGYGVRVRNARVSGLVTVVDSNHSDVEISGGASGRITVDNSHSNRFALSYTDRSSIFLSGGIITGSNNNVFDVVSLNTSNNVFTFDGSSGNRVRADITASEFIGSGLDAIVLQNESLDNDFRGSRIHPGTGTNKYRYGVNILDSAVENTVLVDVNYGPGGDYASGVLNDSGTNTITAYTGGGAGDNIVL